MGEPTEIWAQYKNTDICFDLFCGECGEPTHFDGYRAYAVECGGCGAKWDVPTVITLQPFTGKWKPVVTHLDEPEPEDTTSQQVAAIGVSPVRVRGTSIAIGIGTRKVNNHGKP